MKKKLRVFVFISLVVMFVIGMVGCAPAQTPSSSEAKNCSNADLTIVSGSNSKLFFQDQKDGTKGLLSQFEDETGVKVCVLSLGGPEAVTMKEVMLEKSPADIKPGDPAAFVFDSNMYADGLNDQAYLANTMVGVWIKQSVVTRLGLAKGTPLSMEQYASMLENGSLRIVTAPAYLSTPASVMFFQTLSSFYGANNQLTPEQVQDQEAIAFGKRVYDHYVRSAASTGDAIKMVTSDSANMFDGVVGFESSFLGKDGLNSGLSDPFVFFYFDPSVVSTSTIGRVQLDGDDLENYKKLVEFLTSESAQSYIASVGQRPQKDVTDLDQSLFKSEWGIVIDPAVTLAQPPTYAVASRALEIYRDLYKRSKVVKVLIDVSPSTFQNSMKVSVDGQSQDVFRIQAIDLAMKKVTNPGWLRENGIQPGSSDVFSYYFFSSQRSSLIVETIGADTAPAGAGIDSLIGPATGSWDMNSFNQRMRGLNFESNGTEMFSAAGDMLNIIRSEFSSDKDYYIVILTDGENNDRGLTGNDFYDSWNEFNGKANVTLIGIAFGTDGKSVSSEYTARFGGNTYKGNNDADLVSAFKQIFGR